MDDVSLAAEAKRRDELRPVRNRMGLGWGDILKETHRSVRR